jgi:hypothetical protein
MPYEFGPQQAISYLTERGLPHHVAAAFAGNFDVESGFNPSINEIDPLVEGSRGGFGLYQLTGPRRVQYEEWAPAQGRGLGDPYAQLDFMLHELETTERGARDRILQAQNVDEAARLVSERFLRPGIPHLDRRINAARQYAGLPPIEGLERPGPTQARADRGLGIDGAVLEEVTRPRPRPGAALRSGLGAKVGLNDKGMEFLGAGLQDLAAYLMEEGI